MYVANLMEFKQDSDHCASYFVFHVDTSPHISGSGNQQNKGTLLHHYVSDLHAYNHKGITIQQNMLSTQHARHTTLFPSTPSPPFSVSTIPTQNVHPQILHLHRMRPLLLRDTHSPSL